MFTLRSFLKVALAYRWYRLCSAFRPDTVLQSPRSTEVARARSSRLSLAISRLLGLQVFLGGLAARNDGLEEYLGVRFDGRHQIGILLHPDDEDSLTAVPLTGVLQDVQDVSALDVVHDLLKRNTALRSELVVLCGVP